MNELQLRLAALEELDRLQEVYPEKQEIYQFMEQVLTHWQLGQNLHLVPPSTASQLVAIWVS